MNKRNLYTLARYLEKLPDDYPDFEMALYLNGGNPIKFEEYCRSNGGVRAVCGSAACAVGHGPSAGFLFIDSDFHPMEYFDRYRQPDWPSYARRVFIDPSSAEFYFMFGGKWSYIDNTPAGAAARIMLVLDDAYHNQDDDYESGLIVDKMYGQYHKNNRGWLTSLRVWRKSR